MPENLVNDVVDDEDSQRTARDQDPLNDQVNDLNGKFQDEIQTYEKRIHGLIEGVGMLKERVWNPIYFEHATNLSQFSILFSRLVIRQIKISYELI